MGTIFISYARNDKKTAKELYDLLVQEGYSAWLDTKNLLPGQEWKIEIEKAIGESDIFLACLSTNSVTKTGFVQAELKRALDVAELMPEGKIFIIPVRLDECDVPSSLQKYHYLDYFETDERQKLLQAIQVRAKPIATKIERERLFDAGDRVKAIRDEIGVSTSQFTEILDMNSQREYEIMENRGKEFPLSLLQKVSDVSGANLEWLKHEKGHRYVVDLIYLRTIKDDLEYCARLNPQEYFLTLDKKQLHVGLVVQISEYRFQVLETGINLDFWNWVDEHWAIPAFYHFLDELSASWHDIVGISLPTRYDRELYDGEIHFLTARASETRQARDLLYDLLDLDHTRRNPFSYSRTYGGDWMDRVHEYFKEYLEREKIRRETHDTAAPKADSTSNAIAQELTQTLRGTYDAARKRGYTATYFLQMLEEHGGADTAKQLLAKTDIQTGLFELWERGLLSESMEAVVLQEKFRSLFTQEELAEAHRRLEELGYFKNRR